MVRRKGTNQNFDSNNRIWINNKEIEKRDKRLS